MAQDIGSTEFSDAVLRRSHQAPVVVDFWAPWCGPCRQLGPVLDRLHDEAAGRWHLVKINTDENQGLAQQFGIQGIPAVKAFVGGKVVAEFVGAQPEAAVREWLKRVVPDAATEHARAGLAAAASGDSAAAAARFNDALAVDPGQPDALIFRAEAAAAAGEREEARRLLSRVRARDAGPRAAALARVSFAIDAGSLESASAAFRSDPGDPAAIYAVGNALAAAGEWSDSLSAFFTLVREHRAFADDAGRKAMLRAFDALGPRHALTEEWRRRLSMELFK
jgi:putative thioredoxin